MITVLRHCGVTFCEKPHTGYGEPAPNQPATNQPETNGGKIHKVTEVPRLFPAQVLHSRDNSLA